MLWLEKYREPKDSGIANSVPLFILREYQLYIIYGIYTEVTVSFSFSLISRAKNMFLSQILFS